MNAQLPKENMNSLKKLLEYKDMFAWNSRGIPLELAQHCIKLDTSIPLAH